MTRRPIRLKPRRRPPTSLAAPPSPKSPGYTPKELEEITERLRSLGYLG